MKICLTLAFIRSFISCEMKRHDWLGKENIFLHIDHIFLLFFFSKFGNKINAKYLQFLIHLAFKYCDMLEFNLIDGKLKLQTNGKYHLHIFFMVFYLFIYLLSIFHNLFLFLFYCNLMCNLLSQIYSFFFFYNLLVF